MRHLIFILGIPIIVLVFIAGCTSDSGNGSNIQTTVSPTIPPTSLQQTTVILSTTVTPTMTPTTIPTPDPLGESPKLMTVTTVTGVSGRQSVNVTVPYGYWEMWYTVDPIVTGGQDSHSATGTNSAVFPSLSVVVSDAASGEAIETVEPPGGLDINLWQRSGDPRPWSKKFYEGNKVYSFDITARNLKSYMIEVRVPKI
jgi:hypothetical protein